MGVNMWHPVVLACLAVAAATATPLEDFRSNLEFLTERTNLDDPAYRLLDVVQPTHLTVDLDVYLDESRFNGEVDIDVQVLASLSQIVLHQRVEAIREVTVVTEAGTLVPLAFPDAFTTDDYFELLLINLAEPLQPGNYTIQISWQGRINDNPYERGFYRGYYFLNNQIRYYATTQFQPFYARKAIPCFDEPQFKSTWTLSITRDLALSPSYSNMAINSTQVVAPGRVREAFYTTPVVSAYLIAFHVSDFVETTLTSMPAAPFGIVSRPGVTGQHAYAADIGLRITHALSQYLDNEYYAQGQGTLMKNDHIALPDFPAGAMENWGMVNYREAYLLYDENNTNLQNKIFIATIMAHEMAHKWFGNLVTCFWWSNLWLNESFASFFEYFGTHMADPSLELDDQFVVDYVHSALVSDAGAGATPMNWTGVVSNPTVSAHFSTTSYAKGASVLRMMEHLVGPTVFQNALQIYLRDHAYELGYPSDMYAAFRAAAVAEGSWATQYPGVDVGDVFDSWVQTPGAPVLNVDVNMDTGDITIVQERFQLSGTPHSMLWQIPLTWTDAQELQFNNTKPRRVLSARSEVIQTAPGHRWVIFNVAQSGLYRVNYDDHNWEMIARYLRNNNTRENVHKLNRAQIVNDVLFLLRAGRLGVTRALDVLSFLQWERDYYVWNGALAQLDWVRRRLEHLPVAYDLFHEYLLEIVETAVQHVGYNAAAGDSTSDTLNRAQILNFACNLGHQGCVSDARDKWNAFRQNPANLVPVDLRRHVYCVGVREGDETDYQFLLERYAASENTADMVVMLRALGCTRDPASLQNYLQQSISNQLIRLHDRASVFQFALLGNRDNLAGTLQFLYQNFATMSVQYGGQDRLNVAINSLSAYLTDFEDIVEFQSWVYTNQLALDSGFAAGQGVVTASMNNLAWGNRVAADLVTELRARSSAAAAVASLALVTLAALAHFLH